MRIKAAAVAVLGRAQQAWKAVSSGRRSTTLMVLLLLPGAAALRAQTPCDDGLLQAEKSYQLGLFEDIPGQLADCFKGGISRRTEIQARSLMARAYLYNDEEEKARKEVSTILRLDSTFDASAPASFAALIAQVRREQQTTQVASVSKTNESLSEAPATVVVITSEEIERRGYLDLEELLHDLPGFDISRENSFNYANVFQRGYRSFANDRLILLVDGVEQNELSTNSLFRSRHFPLSNVDRVEVVYGPASTMYGANAYTGVVSVLTKDPESLVGDRRGMAFRGQMTAGEHRQAVDVTGAGRNLGGTIAWSLTANVQKSEERNLSAFTPWNFAYDDVDYKRLLALTGTAQERAALCATPSPYIHCHAAGIELTDQGVALVRDLDRALVRDNGLGFDDRGNNWLVYGKLRISNLTLGLESWRSEEGIGSGALARANAGSTSWTPQMTAFYAKYSVPLEKLKLNVFSRYLQSGHDRASTEVNYLHNYASGFLNMWSLVAPCVAPGDPLPVSCAPAAPWVEKVFFGSVSTQLRSELNVIYDSSEKISAVAGIEFGKSSIQTSVTQDASGPGALLTDSTVSPEQIEHTDVAVYAQTAWKPRRSLKVVMAGRLSHNAITNKPGAEGFGTLFTPRLGLIYLPSRTGLVLKAIYSEAFKDPNDSQKFGTLRVINAFPSGGLSPELVRNVELSAAWESKDGLAFDASVYQARYSDVVGFELVPDCTLPFGCVRYANRDQLRIRGLQLNGRYRRSAVELWGNYTHTQPFQTNPLDLAGNPLIGPAGNRISTLRVADVASDRLNAGVDVEWSNWRNGLRLHYVGARPTGLNTTEPGSPLTGVDAHTTIDATVSYRFSRINTTLQVIARNLSDAQYFDPTVSPVFGAPRVLQAGRTFHFRLIYRLGKGGDMFDP